VTPDGGSQPLCHQHGAEFHAVWTVSLLPVGLPHEARMGTCQVLNPDLGGLDDPRQPHNNHGWPERGQPSTSCTHGCSKRTRMIIGEVRDGITANAANRGDGINDLLMGDLRRRHEVQVRFLHVTTHGERAGRDPPDGDRCTAQQPGRCGNRWGDGGSRFPADEAGDEQVIERRHRRVARSRSTGQDRPERRSAARAAGACRSPAPGGLPDGFRHMK
jgi:hypothetical protein